ncbi:hypothetical protein HZC30_05855 [Candidatus Woesearchaeota archaeon]|nr:hypothetical protein [Candidatus Woesearchaeota archaeon]
MFNLFSTQTNQATIGETNVTVKVQFSKYSASWFNSDFQLATQINSKKGKGFKLPEESNLKFRQVQRYEIFYRKFYHKRIQQQIKTPFNPDYDEFKRFCATVLSQRIFYILKTALPQLITGRKELIINLYAVNKYLENDLAAYVYSNSTDKAIEMEFSGSALTGRIYFLWVYAHKVDASFLERTLTHELEHHLEHRKGMYLKEEETLKNIAEFMQLNPEAWKGSFPALFEVWCNLYAEGLATFVENRKANQVEIDFKQVQKLKLGLIKLSLLNKKSDAEKLVEKEFRSTAESGEYYLGRLMCYFIGLSFLKQKKTEVLVLSQGKLKLPFTELGLFLEKHSSVKLEQLNEETFKEAYAKLSQIKHHREFIALYTKACQELGLKDSLRIVDTKFYHKLLNNAAGSYKHCREVVMG